MKFMKKPVIIEAIQWDGNNTQEILNFTNNKSYLGSVNLFTGKTDVIFIRTLEGDMKAELNDWIIKGVKGEFYPCKPDIFEQIYNKVQ